MDTQRERELALVVLGMALGNKRLLESIKTECDPSDFPVTVTSLVGALMRGEMDAVLEEVKRLWGVEHTLANLSSSMVKHFADHASRRKLIKDAERLSMAVRLMPPDQARELSATLEELRKAAMRAYRDSKPG